MKQKIYASKLVLSLFGLFYLSPFIMTAVYALSREWGKTILPKGWTFYWFQTLFQDADFGLAVLRSAFLALIVLAVVLVVLIPSVLVIVLNFPKLDNYMQGMSLMPYAIPGVILVTALLKTYSKLEVSMLIVLGGALFISALPIMYLGIRNSLLAINTKELMEAGQTLGASGFTIIKQVILPNIRIGVVLSSVMIFSGLFGEYVLTNLLIGGRFETLRIYMLRRMNENGHLASAVMVFYFICIMLIGLLINHLSHRQRQQLKPLKKRDKQIETSTGQLLKEEGI
ncbi:ABC transporter permease subunit [uncultured Vagococcus sp.]|uniref:ABC transporter permease n=1 Tax=uncultured Vagococcus sp. TaxID=189676 RepID=UPI0028D1C405|nr:ABC transporter permease subunit [uncultured Vagococcus sp.]